MAVEDMTTEKQIAQNQDERDEARQDLRDTLTEVKVKAERAEDGLRPDHLIERHAVAASLVAGALGFLVGSTVNSRRTGPIMIAAVLGFALALRSSRDPSEHDGRETSSTD